MQHHLRCVRGRRPAATVLRLAGRPVAGRPVPAFPPAFILRCRTGGAFALPAAAFPPPPPPSRKYLRMSACGTCPADLRRALGPYASYSHSSTMSRTTSSLLVSRRSTRLSIKAITSGSSLYTTQLGPEAAAYAASQAASLSWRGAPGEALRIRAPPPRTRRTWQSPCRTQPTARATRRGRRCRARRSASPCASTGACARPGTRTMPTTLGGS